MLNFSLKTAHRCCTDVRLQSMLQSLLSFQHEVWGSFVSRWIIWRKLQFFILAILARADFNKSSLAAAKRNKPESVFWLSCIFSITFTHHAVFSDSSTGVDGLLWAKWATGTPGGAFCTVTQMLMTRAVGGQIDRITSSDEARGVNRCRWHPRRRS